MMLFERGEFMFNFDLKSGYHHVDIAVKHRKYLGFEWEQCFGLASAPYGEALAIQRFKIPHVLG